MEAKNGIIPLIYAKSKTNQNGEHERGVFLTYRYSCTQIKQMHERAADGNHVSNGDLQVNAPEVVVRPSVVRIVESDELLLISDFLSVVEFLLEFVLDPEQLDESRRQVEVDDQLD